MGLPAGVRRGRPGDPASWWERPLSPEEWALRASPVAVCALALAIHCAAEGEVISAAFSPAPGPAVSLPSCGGAGKWPRGSLHCGPASAEREAVGSGQAAFRLRSQVRPGRQQHPLPTPAQPPPACRSCRSRGVFCNYSVLSPPPSNTRETSRLTLEQGAARTAGWVVTAGRVVTAGLLLSFWLFSSWLLPSGQEASWCLSRPHGLGSSCGWSGWGLLWSFHGVSGLKSLAFGGGSHPQAT